MTSLIVVFLIGELLAAALGVAAWGWCHLWNSPRRPSAGQLAFDVIVPVLGAPEYLTPCVEAIRQQLPSGSRLWIVHQFQEPAESLPVAEGGAVHIVRRVGSSGKVNAIRSVLPHIRRPWVLLVDADTVLAPGAIDSLAAAAHNCDAVYGIILPEVASRRGLLFRIVQLEKLLSHGIWRLGRWVLRLGPNLPGQCYLVRTSLLRELYHSRLGYLDDVMFTAWLLAHGARLGFAPAVAGGELSRETWRGLFAQRVRFTMGIGQGLWGLFACQGRWWRAWQYLVLHTWLYYGAPIAAILLTFLLLASGHRWVSASIFGLFVLHRCVLAAVAAANLRRLGAPKDAIWPGGALVLSVVMLAIVVLAGALGALAAASAGMARRSVPALYHR